MGFDCGKQYALRGVMFYINDEVMVMREFLESIWTFFDKLGIDFSIAILALVILIIILIVFAARRLRRRKPTAHATSGTTIPSGQKSEQLYQKAEQLADRSFDDLPEAFRYYLQAAKLDHVLAQCEAGRLYYYGFGSQKPNKEQGLYWLKRSANGGSVYARILLGRIYDKDMRYQDPGELINWLEEITEDDVEAQYLLSVMYSRKRECYEQEKGYAAGQWKEDPLCMEWYQKSKYWLKQAALNGHKEAQELYW